MKRSWILGTMAVVALLTILVAFINNDNQLNVVKLLVEKDNPSNVSEREMTDNNIDFACNLFRTIYEQRQNTKFESNLSGIVVSPISVSYMLGLLNAGANGKTRQQINDVLGLGGSVEQINKYFMSKKMIDEASDLDTTITMKIANSIIVNESKGLRLTQHYETEMQKYYNVQIESLDFTNRSNLQHHIDNWCNTHTNDKIGYWVDFVPNAAMYMLNAVYFNALWAEKFTRLNNAMQFTMEDGIDFDIYYMHLKTKAAYGKNDLYEVLCLPYSNGGYSMYVLLPRDGKTIGDIILNLSAKKLEEMQSHMATHELDILMPYFTIYDETDLKDVLSAMGMPLAFDESSAEFLNMARRHNNLYVSTMKQKVLIEVKEKGIKAAADTIVDLSQKEDPDIKHFQATRPFVYYIVENSTGTIYFMGTFRGGGEAPQHHPEFELHIGT